MKQPVFSLALSLALACGSLARAQPSDGADSATTAARVVSYGEKDVVAADPAATDSSRVLRLPGYMNHKYGKPFVVRAETRTAATYSPEHFPRTQTDSSRARSLAVTVSDQSKTALSQSERDWAYAKRALVRGDSPQQVVHAISRFRRGEKSDVADYAERTVRKASESLIAEHPDLSELKLPR